MDNKKIGIGSIVKMFLTSLFIQSSFSYALRQAKGLEFVLRFFWKKEDLETFGKRKEFNTNPYLFPTVLGLLLRKEEGVLDTYPQILAAFGDEIFWRKTLPSFALLAIAVWLIFPLTGAGAERASTLLPILLFLIPYNLFTFLARTAGFFFSYKEGVRGVFLIVKTLNRSGKVIEILLLYLIGFVFFSLAIIATQEEQHLIFNIQSANRGSGGFLFILSFFFSLLLKRLNPRFTPEKIILSLLILFIFLLLL